ncbi:ADP-ribosylglycohydrolase family protein [Maribacter sp. PR1]|uniref:ADP-ribosylglycohydrolase family protein n=1 Tax=Maribacter cobaltidurans TaxID=1178778 RepID=A0ABU7IVF9_9FLAO|nr:MULTISPECIES: ADP-ribosylglycohydrolase family protein [Maribacter]MDC6389221.1 ADP-ribosylglycohydrolase family protein [Maribacter sp. PR1]MEE1976608.1 ADP-ribosylglycohydrolase family protein [Maribacter cobaltidurans]
MKYRIITTLLLVSCLGISCKDTKNTKQNESINALQDSSLTYTDYSPKPTDHAIPRSEYANKLYGFWLAECIANWTGLVTEMDKIGNIGEIKTGDFYTREDWGTSDLPNIWSGDTPSDLSETIDFVFRGEDEVWGADDDTDLEYMYQHLLYTNKTSVLTGKQIQEGWLKHMKHEEENYLWVANQRALELMLTGIVPPETSDPEISKDSIYDNYYEMIDAQLTTEIFGLFAPSRPDVALEMAQMPILTTARENAKWISEFYVIMYSLASAVDQDLSKKEQTQWMAAEARKRLPNDSYSAKMYDFVKSRYDANVPWEQARDDVYTRYQVNQEDGYDITSKNIFCNGCFVGGINFAASIVSLLYGEGDLKETIKIGVLSGWDSDNPTATWGGLLGFMYGKEGVENTFGRKFSEKFNIHRTRVNFPNDGMDNFDDMAKKGVYIIDRVVQEEMGGGIDLTKDVWYIPTIDMNIKPGN